MKIIPAGIEQMVEYCKAYNSSFSLIEDDLNLMFQGMKVGGKISYYSHHEYPLQKLLTIVSRNACYNSFKFSKVEEYRKYILHHFTQGVHLVCLQDFPYHYTDLLSITGHVLYITYAIGNNGEFLANVMIFNPNYLSKAEFLGAPVTYMPENPIKSGVFVPGTLIVSLDSKKLILGSLYSSFESTVYSRRASLIGRYNLIHKYKEKKGYEVIICGDLNPRANSRLTNQGYVLNTGCSWFDSIVYMLRQVPLIILSRFFNITPWNELENNCEFGLFYPIQSTMRDLKKFGILLPLSKMRWTMDGCQATVSPDKVIFVVLDNTYVTLSDHYGVMARFAIKSNTISQLN